MSTATPNQFSVDRDDEPATGLALIGLVVGLLTGVALYGIIEFWIDEIDGKALPTALALFVVTVSAVFLLTVERTGLLRAALAAFAIGAIIAAPDYFMAGRGGVDDLNLSLFPIVFWFAAGRYLAIYLLAVLVKASLEAGAPPPYARVFAHGVTMPLIIIGAFVFALLALVLLFAWAFLLKSMEIDFFADLFQEPWFILPFLGAIGGLSIALMRGQQAVLGALRYILQLFARILMPITAVFTVILLAVLASRGVVAVFSTPAPSIFMMVLALAGMLIFNGVYQNGQNPPPALWLRLATLIAIAGFPIYAWLAFYAFSIRIESYGLTPARIYGVAINGLVALYSIVCICGLATEANWRGRRWMPLVGPLNTAMAGIWVAVLVLLSTPVFNPWAMSAESQFQRIAQEKESASRFDFGYLKFQLGPYGEDALERMLSLESHPEFPEIRAGVERAQTASNYWEYRDRVRAANPTKDIPPAPFPLEDDATSF
ncbi:MAG: DUF4153 domain-containing protein [Pseudomonadota bacterium]